MYIVFCCPWCWKFIFEKRGQVGSREHWWSRRRWSIDHQIPPWLDHFFPWMPSDVRLKLADMLAPSICLAFDSGSDRGLKYSCDDTSSSESEAPMPVDFMPECLDTEYHDCGWHPYYKKVLRKAGKGYKPFYPGPEGVQILNDSDTSDGTSDDSSDDIVEIGIVNESPCMPVSEAMD